MSFELTDYIFFDDNFNIIQESGLHDDDVADSRCSELMRVHNKTVSCYRLISIYDPETTPRADELRNEADDVGQSGLVREQTMYECGNCGVPRFVHGVILEACPNCGDDETDLSLIDEVP